MIFLILSFTGDYSMSLFVRLLKILYFLTIILLEPAERVQFKLLFFNNLKLQIESKKERLNIARTKKRELPYLKTDLKFDKKQIIYIFFIFYLIRISWMLISWSIKQLKK